MGRSGNPVFNAVFGLLILIFAGGPVVLSLVGSLISDRVLFDPARGLFDDGVTLANYRYIFLGEIPPAYMQEGATRGMITDAARQVPGSLWNSMQIALSTMGLNLLLGAPAAFLYARYWFPGKRLTFLFVILSPLVPAVALITPIYITVEFMGLLGTKLAIILVHTARTLPFTVLILSVFFRRMPAELFEAAVIDGCSRLQAFLRIGCPLALPPIATTGLFAFMLSYAEYMFSHVLSGDARSRPISVVMAALARNTDVSWSLMNSTIFIAIVPTLILVILVWRYVVEGLMRGAVKG